MRTQSSLTHLIVNTGNFFFYLNILWCGQVFQKGVGEESLPKLIGARLCLPFSYFTGEEGKNSVAARMLCCKCGHLNLEVKYDEIGQIMNLMLSLISYFWYLFWKWKTLNYLPDVHSELGKQVGHTWQVILAQLWASSSAITGCMYSGCCS